MTQNQSFLLLINDLASSKDILWLYDMESPSNCDTMGVKPDGLIDRYDPIKTTVFQEKGQFLPNSLAVLWNIIIIIYYILCIYYHKLICFIYSHYDAANATTSMFHILISMVIFSYFCSEC